MDPTIQERAEYPLHVDAQALAYPGLSRHAPHGQAVLAVAEVEHEGDEHQYAYPEGHQPGIGGGDAADVDHTGGYDFGHGMGDAAPHQEGDAREDHASQDHRADEGHHLGLGPADQGPHQEAVYQQPDDGGQSDHQDQGCRPWHADLLDEPPDEIGEDQQNAAVGQVYDLGGLGHDHYSKDDQGIDSAQEHALKGRLQECFHITPASSRRWDMSGPRRRGYRRSVRASTPTARNRAVASSDNPSPDA